jgi:hypothetical protein
MGNVSTAFRAFFASLFNRETASRVQNALNLVIQPETKPTVVLPDVRQPVGQAKTAPEKPRQSEAITLLATLQREARLVDFLKEDLSEYSDDQVGAAVREIHRESGAVIDRLFAIRPILEDTEGAAVEIPSGFDAARYRITGKMTSNAPFRGTLRHHGWEVTKCELPEFVGSQSATKTIAPAEVEVQ